MAAVTGAVAAAATVAGGGEDAMSDSELRAVSLRLRQWIMSSAQSEIAESLRLTHSNALQQVYLEAGVEGGRESAGSTKSGSLQPQPKRRRITRPVPDVFSFPFAYQVARFPDINDPAFGSRVWVMKKGVPFACGHVRRSPSCGADAGAAEQQPGRLRVVYKDGTFYNARKSQVVAIQPANVRSCVVVSETSMYRRLAKTQVRSVDTCLEIGSDFGATTKILDSVGSRAVGIDKNQEHVAQAAESHPGVKFVCADVLRDPEVLQKHPATCVFVDINGNRMLGAVLECVQIVQAQLLPRLIVVKSKELFKALAVPAS